MSDSFRRMLLLRWPLVKTWWAINRTRAEIPADLLVLGDTFVARVDRFLTTGV